ncbi:MAG TPA: hypothetical protein P5509_04820 [Bacteroidales bacterium]|nr:hypothetical protein [Bacteroidales bacterium]
MTDFKKWYTEKGGKSIIVSLRYNEDILNEVLERTSFLPDITSVSERVYCLINNIKETLLCDYCGKPRKFMKLDRGYHGTCQSKECIKKHRSVVNKESAKKVNKEESFKKQRETFMKIYGKPHNWCNGTSSRNKYHQTMEKHYGKKYPLQVSEIKRRQENTLLKRYGTIGFLHHPKMIKTLIENFPDAYNELTGNANIMTSKKGHEIWQDSIEKHYGVRNPMQVREVFNKQQKSAFQLKQYKNYDIYYRGTYELDFLKKFYDKIDIKDPIITPEYTHNDTKRKYFPDFYVPSKNLIIEIKSSYYYKRDRATIIQKALSVLRLGYEFIIIIDKDYTEFEKFINS